MKINEARSKIRNSHFGKKSKKLLNEWIDHESIGGVGMGLFEVPPVIERAKGSVGGFAPQMSVWPNISFK